MELLKNDVGKYMHDSREEIRAGNKSPALLLVVWNYETGIARLLGEIFNGTRL